MRFYKGRYIIAFYTEQDELCAVFDNIYELSEATHKTYKFWSDVFFLTECFFDGELRKSKSKGKFARFCNVFGPKCRIHFITAESECV